MKINRKIAQTLSIFYQIKELFLSFREVFKEFGIDTKAMGIIKIEDIGKSISISIYQ